MQKFCTVSAKRLELFQVWRPDERHFTSLGYGLTETSPMILFPPVRDWKVGAAGVLCSNTVCKVNNQARSFRLKSKKYSVREVPIWNTTQQNHLASCFAHVIAQVRDVENNESLGPNKEGELCIKGPQVMKGYLGNPAATKETIDEEGWIHTGSSFVPFSFLAKTSICGKQETINVASSCFWQEILFITMMTNISTWWTDWKNW